MADILWLAAVVYSNGTCGTGDLRGICDVVCWSSGDMYGSGVKKAAADRKVKSGDKI